MPPRTPPSSQDVTVRIDTTPLKRDVPGSQTHTSTPRKRASQRYMDMTFDTCSKFVGPMPVGLFLEEFMPGAPAPRPQGDFLFSKTSVSHNEDEFIEAVRSSGLCPNLRFMNTTNLPGKSDPEYRKPDISVFSSVPKPDSVIRRPEEFRWETVELWIENKTKRQDPFIQIEELQKHAKRVSCHVGWTIRDYKICGQLIAYARAVHRYQFRIFSFSVAIFEDTVRLLRWDRGGVIYTEPFKWADEGLFEFLWRFNHLSAADRGYDITICSAGDDEAEAALPKLRAYFNPRNLEKEHLHRIQVWDDRASDDEPRCYITPSAKWATDALVGRATFGYIAYDVESGDLVYLKDFWRVDHPEIQTEGDVYHELHKAQVPNIAKLGRASDVRLTIDNGQAGADVGVQRTRTQTYLGHSWCPGRPDVETYVHYRLVLETVGMPLNQFKSTRQLCEVIRDAVVAHTAAYNKARILHRDISAGNILITEKGTGILIDWDLSKKVKVHVDADAKPRRHSRTGTWQFISISRLLDPWSRPHEVSDDLESFFWVLMYEVVRYRSTATNLRDAMRHVFDHHSEPDEDGIVTGGNGKLACVADNALSSGVIIDIVETPCFEIIEEMRSLFRDLHLMEDAYLTKSARLRVEERRKRDPRVNVAREKLRTSDAFLAIFERHLGSEWDINDGSLDQTETQRDQSASRSRRKRKAEEIDSGENMHVARIGRMPTNSKDRVVGGQSSETTRSSFNGDSLFSGSFRKSSSGIVSSKSRGSRNNGPPSKQ